MLSNRSRAAAAVVLASVAVFVSQRRTIARAPDLSPAKGEQTLVVAGGCFWGIQAVFERVKGVTSAVSGYAGGSVASPTYEQVSSGRTGHAEAVRIIYDPNQVALETLLDVFFTVAHDPTQLNRQGPDVGTQYRSAILFAGDEQQHAVEAYVKRLGDEHKYARPIVTQIVPLKAFYPAEEYHQHYADRHPNDPYIFINDRPKVEALREKFPQLYREPPAS